MHDHPQNRDVRLLDGEFYAADPHPHFQWMHAHAPVYFDETSGVWGVARYDALLEVAKDPKTFCNSEGIRPDAPPLPYLIDLDDPQHKRRRNLVNKGFSVRRVQEKEPRIRAIAIDLIERARARGEFDFVMDLAAWLPLIVIGDALGVVAERYPDLLQWSDDLVRGSGTTDFTTTQRASDALEAYLGYQRAVLTDRRGRPLTEDLVSILVHAEIDGEKLSDDEILWDALLILIGGDETTRHVISGGTYELLQRPDAMRTLAAAPARIPVAVEEMLRWVSPIQNMARTATHDANVCGQRIEEGQKLLLLYPAANRDPHVFSDPMRFDIGRTPNEHIAFGFGAHFCLGASLARLELRVFFEELLARMPNLELASDALPPRRASNFITGIEHLPVRVRK